MNRSRCSLTVVAAATAWVSACGVVGCGYLSWHNRVGWEADDYFDAPQVIALCEAIEADDLDEIDRLIEAGADVNALGKGNMSPLLWAFPENKIERFRRLLEHGADPNVCVTEDFGTNILAITPGYAVTHLAIKSRFSEHYKAVLEHGGNANLSVEGKSETDFPLHIMLRSQCSNKKTRLRALLDRGADLNALGRGGMTPASTAYTFFGQYSLALEILKSGADPRRYHGDELRTIAHLVIVDLRNIPHLRNDPPEALRALIDWLNENAPGLLDTAKDDLLRWKSYTGTIAQIKAKQRREIEERKAREAAERKKQQGTLAEE